MIQRLLDHDNGDENKLQDIPSTWFTSEEGALRLEQAKQDTFRLDRSERRETIETEEAEKRRSYGKQCFMSEATKEASVEERRKIYWLEHLEKEKQESWKAP